MAAGDLIYCNGFEGGVLADDGINITTGTGVLLETLAAAAFTGTTGMHVKMVSGQNCQARCLTSDASPFPSGVQSAGMHLRVNFVSFPAARHEFFRMARYTGAGDDLVWYVDNLGQLQIGDGTTFSAVIGTITTGTWFLIEGRFDNTTSTETFAGRVNRGTEQTGSVVSTAGGFNGYWFGCSGAASQSLEYYADDLVYCTGNVYPTQSTYTGGFRVKAMRPSAVLADLDTNYSITGGDTIRGAAVDDVTSDDATTYIQSSTSGQIQRIPLIPYTVLADETPLLLQLEGKVGADAATGTRNFTVNWQDSAGTDHATTAVFDALVAGWKYRSAYYGTITKPGGSALDAAYLSGPPRIKLTKSATTDIVRATQFNAYVALGVITATGNPVGSLMLMGVGR